MYICLEEVNIFISSSRQDILFPSRQLKLQDYMFIILIKMHPRCKATKLE